MGERETLCEQEPQASVSTAFSSSPKLSWVFLELYKNTKNMFSVASRKHCNEKRKTACLFAHQNVNVHSLC